MLLDGIGFYKRPFVQQTNTQRIIAQGAKLEELLGQGKSLREIGNHFGVSRGLIAHVFRELGLRSKRTNGCVPQSQWIHHKEKLLAMLRSGMKRSEIAKEFGVTRNAIVGACDRLKLNDDEIVRTKTREAVREQMRVLSARAHAKLVANGRRPGVKRQVNGKDATMINSNAWRFHMRAKAPPPDSATRRTLMELGLGHCRYPLDEEVKFYCGAQTETETSSWCPYHAQFVFRNRAVIETRMSGDVGGSHAAASRTGVESPCSPAKATRPHQIPQQAEAA